MNERRWLNVKAARHSYDSGQTRTSDGPLEAFFEVAARCNLRCQMCAISYDSRYRPRSGRPALLTPDLFERLEPIFPTLLRAYLFGLGEPLLNPHLISYIRKLSDAGAEVWFNTNATLIDQKKADELARAGVRRITVSIDGATAETYERIRVGAKFEAVTRGIRALVEAQSRFGNPVVNLSIVAMASNIQELPQLVDLCADLGAEGIHVEPLYWQQQLELEQHYQRENLGVLAERRVSDLLDDSMARAEERGVKLASRFLFDRHQFDYVEQAATQQVSWTCSEPWSSVWVTAAGEVRTCCINETSFGNLFERSFADIWHGPEFEAFRRQHASRDHPTGCANCIRNGRVRHSPFFAPVHAVTYRPIARKPDLTGPPLQIEWPTVGETVTDPFVLKGRWMNASPGHWEVMLDLSPLMILEGGLTGETFVASGSIPFVSEGAHLLWIRRVGEAERGFEHREIFFWRPDAAPDLTRTTTASAFRLFKPGLIGSIEIYIDEFPWNQLEVIRPGDYRGSSRWVFLDLAALPPGFHTVTPRIDGVVDRTLFIQRLGPDL